MTFNKWIDTFIAEKGIDTEQTFVVPGPSGGNTMPYGVVIEAMKSAHAEEQARLKTLFVGIDFKNGDVRHALRYLAQALAI